VTTICRIPSCDAPMTAKSARGMCPRHYSSWRRTGYAVKACAGCGDPVSHGNFRYCSESCKPRCSVDGCEGPVRKRGWCASHYHQAKVSGREPKPFKYKWSDLVPCMNCGAVVDKPEHRKFCTNNCHMAYRLYGGPRPTSTECVACGVTIDLTERGKRGQLRKTVVKLCRPCKRDYNKYKMSARELAKRDGTDCGICGSPVDMTLARSDGLDCPSVDHIMPRSRGGSHDPSNLQLAHLRCNMAKSDRVSLSPALTAPWRGGVVAS
jgi:5-methylcytosine-specific restriction endonuclease McrA